MLLRVLLCLTVLLPAATAPGQERKPEPAPYQPQVADVPDLNTFADAYRRADRPRVLVLCGLDQRAPASAGAATGAATGAAGGAAASGPQATGVPAADGRHLGRDIVEFSSTGVPQMLGAEIKRYLLLADVDVVNTDALQERDLRQLWLLANDRRSHEVESFRRKINADIVMLVRMIPGSAVESRGGAYRVIAETIQVSSGRQIGSFTFDWRLGQEAEAVKQYGQVVTRRFMDDFVIWYRQSRTGTPQRYSIQFHGLNDAGQLKSLVEGFGAVVGVEEVQSRGLTRGRRDSVGELTLTFTGANWALAEALEKAATRSLQRTAVATDVAAGSITLRFSEGSSEGLAADDLWEALIDKDHPDHQAILKRFGERYEAAGSPRMAVMVNRGMVEASVPQPGPDTRVIVITGDAQSTQPDQARHAEATAVDLRRMEDLVIERLRELGVQVVDAAMVRRGVVARLDGQRADIAEDDLTTLVKDQGGVDILIHGVGRVQRPAADQAADDRPRTSVTYTFRATRMSDGLAIAARSRTWDLWSAPGEAMTHNRQAEIADWITGHLGADMLVFWAGPHTIQVIVRDARSQSDVINAMNGLMAQVPVVKYASFVGFDPQEDGGVGRLKVNLTASPDELTAQIRQRQNMLPFTVVDDPAPDGRTLVVKMNR